jgi:hypothetical protein
MNTSTNGAAGVNERPDLSAGQDAIFAGPEAAAVAWRASGLLLPPLPRELADAIRQFGPMSFGTHDADPADRDGWLARARDPDSPAAVAMNHAGHGVNSYALSYQLIQPALAAFVRQSFGGVYGDQEAERKRFNAIVERLEEVVILADAASRSSRIQKGHRLVIVIDDLGGGGWERAPGGSWQASERPIDDALRSLAAVH